MPKRKPKTLTKPTMTDFDAVVELIRSSRSQAIAAVNTTLIDLYWRIGEYLSDKINSNSWGQATVKELATHISRTQPGVTGFSASNLWRMRQFFDIYSASPKLAPLVRQLPWSHNLAILSRCKRDVEREFYLRMTSKERWTHRELHLLEFRL